MRPKGVLARGPDHFYNQANDFPGLLRYINYLARHKLGYPVSLLTYLGVINNKILGIEPNSLANVLLNNVGDPFKDSETSLMEVKRHEREVIIILEKYYGLKPNEARGYVTTGGTEGNFAALWWSKRFFINSAINTIVDTDNKIKIQSNEEQNLLTLLAKTPFNEHESRLEKMQKIIELKNLINENKNIVQQSLIPTVFYSKEHTHYSVGKIAEILRLNIRGIASNKDGSIDLNNFKKELLLNLKAFPYSPIIVIANIGTTVTGAIDDVPGIRKIIEANDPKPLYTIHMDGALSGFVLPIIKPFGNVENYFDAIGVNTLAVSAHKFPGLSQPCGIILARRSFFEKAFEKSERNIDYVGNISDVTITGSRSGLNVLMFYNAISTLGLNINNDIITQMVNANLNMAKYLYNELIKVFDREEVFYPYHFNVMFPRPSKELARKYQLMLTGKNATICVLTNVTKELIDQFILDLKLELKEKVMSKPNLDYTIVPLSEQYAKAATALFVNTFCNTEPLTKHIHIKPEEYEIFAKEVIHNACIEGLSKIALDKEGRVIACCIAEDLAKPFVPKLERYKKLKPIFTLIKELSEPFLGGKKFVSGKILHVWLAMVDLSHRGIRLSTKIVMAVIDDAVKKGYDFAYAEFTNELSEKVTRQFDSLKLFNRIEYDNFRFDNTFPFKGVKGAATCYVATMRPGIKLDSLSKCYTVDKAYETQSEM